MCSFCLQTWPDDLTSARQEGLGEGTITTSSQQLPDENPRRTPGPVFKVPSLDMTDVLETEGIAHAHVSPESLRASRIVGTGILLPCGEDQGEGMNALCRQWKCKDN